MSEKDPQASDRVRNILQSPAYLRADRDVDFLNDNDVRGARLQLDYLKTELNLRRQGIEQTIVVFGSARIPDPLIAKQRVAELHAALQKTPDDVALTEKAQIAERILANSHYYKVAREFATLVANSGEGPDDTRVTVMTGGGPGIMEGANRGFPRSWPSAFITLRFANCTSCYVPGRWSRSLVVLERSMRSLKLSL